MKGIFKSEFSEIHYSTSNNAVILKWLPENYRMSEWEFREQLDTLFNMVEVFSVAILVIDAYEFNYPLTKGAINQLNTFLNKCPVKTFGLVKSKYLMGTMGILRLIKNIHLIGCRLVEFDTRDECEFWYKVMVVMESSKDLE